MYSGSERQDTTILLNFADIERIEETGFSSLDKHYIRLLAHCLACFKTMTDGSTKGQLPTSDVCLKWLLEQDGCQADESFASSLLEQFLSAANQLERLADHFEISPLELTLDHLINFQRFHENSKKD